MKLQEQIGNSWSTPTSPNNSKIASPSFIRREKQSNLILLDRVISNTSTNQDNLNLSPSFIDMVTKTMVKDRFKRNRMKLDDANADYEFSVEKDRIYEIIHKETLKKTAQTPLITNISKSKLPSP